MRKVTFANEEYYHIYNRGVEKRDIFEDKDDFSRFLQSLQEFNTLAPIGSLYENSFIKKDRPLGDLVSKSEQLIEIVAYCLNPNHFHLLVKQVNEKGIEKFMHRLGVGYTMYFNKKHERTGSLFQGTFKAVHVDSNEYLLHLSVYINLNNKVHQLGDLVSKSSWGAYVDETKLSIICSDTILQQFGSRDDYQEYAAETITAIKEKRLLAEESF